MKNIQPLNDLAKNGYAVSLFRYATDYYQQFCRISYQDGTQYYVDSVFN